MAIPSTFRQMTKSFSSLQFTVKRILGLSGSCVIESRNNVRCDGHHIILVIRAFLCATEVEIASHLT